MTAKNVVQDFYKSDALIDPAVMASYLHDDVQLEWHSSTGIIKFDRKGILAFAEQTSKAYVRTKVRISHLVAEDDTVSVRYLQSVKTIENPREEMPLAQFFAIWEVRDGKLYRGYQMSQPSVGL